MQKIISRRFHMTEKADVYCFLCKTKLPEPKDGEVQCMCCKVTYTNIEEDYDEQLGKLTHSGSFFEE